MNQVKEIKSAEDIQRIADQAPIVVINSFRGHWCPFCVKYLKDLQKAFGKRDEVLVVGVSAYDAATNDKLKNKLKLGFDILPDQDIVMHKELGVTLGKGHGLEAYLQPSIFIYHNGKLVHEWIQTPKMLNFGGAIARMPVSAVLKEVNKLS